MKILHASSELYPLIKTGGLADVLGALPFAQQQRGDDVRVVLPYYRQVREALPDTTEVAARDTFGGHVVVRYADYQGVGLYLVDAPHLYDRGGNPITTKTISTTATTSSASACSAGRPRRWPAAWMKHGARPMCCTPTIGKPAWRPLIWPLGAWM